MPANVMTISDLRAAQGPPRNPGSGPRRAVPNDPIPAYNNTGNGPSNVQFAQQDDPDNMSPFPSIKNVLAKDFQWKSFIFLMTMVQLLVFIGELTYQAVTHGGNPFDTANPGAGPGGDTFEMFGAVSRALLLKYQFWRFITPIFIHASILHLFMNLAFQTMLCYSYELYWGHARTIGFYFAGGLGGCCLSASTSNSLSVGASGALCAMIGAQISYVCLNWNDAESAQRPQQMCSLVCYSLFLVAFGFMGNAASATSHVDNWAHVGGFGAGVLLGFTFPGKVEGALGCTAWKGREYLTGGLYLAFIGTTMALIFLLPK